MNTSRKKYRRSLQVKSLVRLVMIGVVTSIVSGAFVVVKNRQHSLANEKSNLESEIASIDKQIETLDLRIASMIGRKAITARLAEYGDGLVKIERAEKVMSGAQAGEQFASYRRVRDDRNNF